MIRFYEKSQVAALIAKNVGIISTCMFYMSLVQGYALLVLLDENNHAMTPSLLNQTGEFEY